MLGFLLAYQGYKQLQVVFYNISSNLHAFQSHPPNFYLTDDAGLTSTALSTGNAGPVTDSGTTTSTGLTTTVASRNPVIAVGQAILGTQLTGAGLSRGSVGSTTSAQVSAPGESVNHVVHMGDQWPLTVLCDYISVVSKFTV